MSWARLARVTLCAKMDNMQAGKYIFIICNSSHSNSIDCPHSHSWRLEYQTFFPLLARHHRHVLQAAAGSGKARVRPSGAFVQVHALAKLASRKVQNTSGSHRDVLIPCAWTRRGSRGDWIAVARAAAHWEMPQASELFRDATRMHYQACRQGKLGKKVTAAHICDALVAVIRRSGIPAHFRERGPMPKSFELPAPWTSPSQLAGSRAGTTRDQRLTAGRRTSGPLLRGDGIQRF